MDMILKLRNTGATLVCEQLMNVSIIMDARTSAATELERFLKDEKRRVFVFQGPWGIGKTHFWREFVVANKTTVKEPIYSYISLFAVSSTEQVKNLILANALGEGRKAAAIKAARGVKKVTDLAKGVDVPVPFFKAGQAAVSNALVALAGSDGWNPTDYARLNQFSEDALYAYITDSRRADLNHLLRELLRRASADTGPAGQQLAEKVKKVLAKIGQRNPVDQWRTEHILQGLVEAKE